MLSHSRYGFIGELQRPDGEPRPPDPRHGESSGQNGSNASQPWVGSGMDLSDSKSFIGRISREGQPFIVNTDRLVSTAFSADAVDHLPIETFLVFLFFMALWSPA